MLYDELSRPSIGHRVALEKRGLLRVVDELRIAGVAVVVPGGHVFATDYLDRIHRAVSDASPIGSREVAALCDLSHGQARAVLDYFVQHNRLTRRGRVWSLVDDAAAEAP